MLKDIFICCHLPGSQHHGRVPAFQVGEDMTKVKVLDSQNEILNIKFQKDIVEAFFLS